MRPQALDHRIAAALRLAPMTTRELSIALSVHWRTAWDHVRTMESLGLVAKEGIGKTRGAPAARWRMS